MTRLFPVAIALCIVSLSAPAQTPASFPAAMYSRLTHPALQQQAVSAAVSDTLGQNLIVGFPNPNEVRDISTSMTIYGDIIVANNAELHLTGADITLHGNIILVNNGKLISTGGTIRFASHYRYERSILALNKSSFAISGTTVSLGGFNIGCSLSDTAFAQLGNMSIQNGVMTTSVMAHATFQAANASNLGEILFFDQSRGAFDRCSGLLTWTTAQEGGSLDVTYPGTESDADWVFPDSAGTASGLQYSIEYTYCSNLLWGLIHEDGATVHVRNSDLLACGALFNGPGQVTVSGLVNNTVLQSYRFPAADRDVQFTNTRVGAWNLYPRGDANVQISNCIIGELLCMGNGSATLANSICDGTGGFVGTNDASSLLIVNSQIFPDLIAKSTASIITTNSSVTNGSIVAANNAVIALLNTSYSAVPVTEAGSVVFVAGIDEPSTGYTGDLLPVYGSVRMFRGNDVPVYIDSWWMDFGLASIPDDRRSLTGKSGLERYREQLADWNTDGLNAGSYAIYMTVRLSSDDTLTVQRPVSLIDAPVGITAFGRPETYAVQPYPNPVAVGNVVHFDIIAPPGMHNGELRIYNSAGTEVLRRNVALNSNKTVLSVSTNALPPGTYLGVFRGAQRQQHVFTLQVTQ